MLCQENPPIHQASSNKNKNKNTTLCYGSKPPKCLGYYDGTVMYGTTVANIRLYVVKTNLETLLNNKVCEELGIITFNS